MEQQQIERTLPTVKDLFIQSWHRLVEKLSNLVVLGVVTFVASIISLLVFGGVGLFMSFSSGLFAIFSKLSEDYTMLSKISTSTWISFGVLFVLFFVFSLILGIFTSLAPLLVIEQNENKLDIGALVKKVLGLILPMFVVGIITSFFMWGSFFFFFFPALFVAYFLMFTQFEVLFEGKRGFAALKSSFQMVSQHFGEILIRCLVYTFFYLIILVVFPAIVSKIDKNLGTIVSLFMIIVQWLTNLYGVVFSITLYKQIKAATDVTKKTSMTWLFIVTILGWIIFGIIAYAGVRVGMNQLKGGAWKQYLNTLEKPKQPEQTAKIYSHVPSNCGLSIPLPITYDTLTKKTRHWIYEERPLAVDSFRNLAPEVTSTEIVLGTFFGYKSDDLRFKPEDKSFRSTTGIDTVCVNNVKDWNLNQFIEAAQKNKKYTVTKNLGFLTWGNVKVYSIFVEGITQGGDYFKEPLNLGVTADGKRLFYIKQWGVSETDPNAKQITSDISTILNGLEYRTVAADAKN